MNRDVRERALAEVEDRDLSGRAAEEVERALRESELFGMLAESVGQAERARSVLSEDLRAEDTYPGSRERFRSLDHGVEELEDALSGVAERIMIETVRTEVGGHEVVLTQSTEVECPVCNEDEYVDPETGETLDSVSREAFYLGTATIHGSAVEGWICGTCETELETTESGAVVVAEDDSEVREGTVVEDGEPIVLDTGSDRVELYNEDLEVSIGDTLRLSEDGSVRVEDTEVRS